MLDFDPGPTVGPSYTSETMEEGSTAPPTTADSVTETGRPKRANIGRLPARYRDLLPDPVPVVEKPSEEPAGPLLPRVTLIYLHRPSYDPDSLISVEHLSTHFPAPSLPVPKPESEAPLQTANRTTSLLMNWVINGNTTKSEAEINALVHDVIQHPDFKVEELVKFDAHRANKQVDANAQAALPLLANFKETTVSIEVPSGSTSVPLVSVIRAAFTDPLSRYFHFSPFKLFQKVQGSAEEIRIFSEIYNSDAFIAEHDHIQRHGKLPPDDPQCKREKIIAALMGWSDSTHLANFGIAKLWPIYILFGNLSKYIRGKPNIGAEHHLAYIPSDKVLTARRFIYKLAFGIGSSKVEDLLKETSSVPTLNAFIERIGDDFNLHQMLVVDFMHEFELGGLEKFVAQLDRRYRQMPRFGSTIRRFVTNASEMKKLAARDFEDLLQCAVPAFDGLFPPEHNARILKLLYRMAEWHTCAKLRMHSDPTLKHLETLTREVGRLMREFKNTTCSQYETYELPRETAARARKEQRAAAAAAARASGSNEPTQAATALAPPVALPKSKKLKILNLSTYKWHGMGDYVPTIKLFGPTDSYSTQVGESLHRLVKRMYGITNKRTHAAQIAARVMCLARARAAARKSGKHAHHVVFGQGDPLGATPPDIHHHTSKDRRNPLDMSEKS
ncbi:hypothetical protein MSAN_00829600 [Mycena sanguinolenta]|uniref:Uncharacterized protein n=1 Tax=Mycena sanguinolenta TaxID=230812 RepID=A0A8H7D9W2_9AGAR|nr:hypothetical protein MSAN_00829600 [Mycena sanguinolenta]